MQQRRDAAQHTHVLSLATGAGDGFAARPSFDAVM